MLLFINIISFIYSIIGAICFIRFYKKIQKQLDKNKSDINSLHSNQVMLLSSIKELHREMKKHDKKYKIRNIFKEENSQ